MPAAICENICSSVPRAPATAVCVAAPTLAEIGDVAGAALAVDDEKSSPASGVPFRPSTSTGMEGPASRNWSPRSSTRARTRPHSLPLTKMSPTLRVPRWTSTVATGHGRVQLRLDDDAFGRAVGIGLQVEQLGLQQDRFLELVEAGLLGRRDLDVEDVAAELLDDELVLQQLLAHALGLGVGLVDLVDGDDDRHLRRLGVADRLDRLLLDAVIGGDDQHDDVGHVGAARPHRREGLVARRIDEGDALAAASAST